MKLCVYSILDSRVGVYSHPFYSINDASAVRAVLIAHRDQSSAIGAYPEDYVLYRIGNFDDSVGLLEPIPPQNMGSVAALVASHLSVVKEA